MAADAKEPGGEAKSLRDVRARAEMWVNHPRGVRFSWPDLEQFHADVLALLGDVEALVPFITDGRWEADAALEHMAADLAEGESAQ